MKFNYLAPVEYNDLTSGFKTVESEYCGPVDFKIFVDRKTRRPDRGVEFDHDGCPRCHGGTDGSDDEKQMIHLHAHNPNHIALMAMITNCEDHPTDTIVETVCEQYNMVYQRFEHPTLDHTYDLKKVTIDERGVVTYPWFQLESATWKQLVQQGKSTIQQYRQRLATDFLTPTEEQKINYCIEIIQYVIDNEVSKNQPWKLAWPIPELVSLDNSVPIGLPDGVPNPPKDTTKTTYWGCVSHDTPPEYGENGLDAVCPTTKAEADAIDPWAYEEGYASHCHKVKHNSEIEAHLCEHHPELEITQEMINQMHEEEWAKLHEELHNDDHPDDHTH